MMRLRIGVWVRLLRCVRKGKQRVEQEDTQQNSLLKQIVPIFEQHRIIFLALHACK